VVGFGESAGAQGGLAWAGEEAGRAGPVLPAIHVMSWPFDSYASGIAGLTHNELDELHQASIVVAYEAAGPGPDLGARVRARRRRSGARRAVPRLRGPGGRPARLRGSQPVADGLGGPSLPEPRHVPGRRRSSTSGLSADHQPTHPYQQEVTA
jgi:hypothetical protein